MKNFVKLGALLLLMFFTACNQSDKQQENAAPVMGQKTPNALIKDTLRSEEIKKIPFRVAYWTTKYNSYPNQQTSPYNGYELRSKIGKENINLVIETIVFKPIFPTPTPLTLTLSLKSGVKDFHHDYRTEFCIGKNDTKQLIATNLNMYVDEKDTCTFTCPTMQFYELYVSGYYFSNRNN